jgi:hypothetical protein
MERLQLKFSKDDLEDALRTILDAVNVFTFLKMLFADPSTQSTKEERQMIMAVKEATNRALERYYVTQELPDNVATLFDIYREYLRFLLDETRECLMSRSGMNDAELHSILEYSSRMVVALSPLYNSPAINHFRRLLRDAGFPKNVQIRSEPKLAASAYTLLLLRLLKESL